jgi:hypothetical protein
MEDKRNILKETEPYTYKLIGIDKAQVFYLNRLVFTAVGKDFRKLEKAIHNDDAYQIQLCMAKMTGNFKHGNERRDK